MKRVVMGNHRVTLLRADPIQKKVQIKEYM